MNPEDTFKYIIGNVSLQPIIFEIPEEERQKILQDDKLREMFSKKE